MPVSSIRVTEGSGPYLNTWQRSVSSVNREEQYVQLGEPALPTFSVLATSISVATADDHVLQIMAGSSSYVRIHRIVIDQASNATAVGLATFFVLRLSTAGSGGSTVTARPFDTADTVSATAMTLPSSKGTEGVALLQAYMVFRQALLATATQADDTWEWTQAPGKKPIIIPAGTSNGIAIKSTTARAGATCNVMVEFTETAWL